MTFTVTAIHFNALLHKITFQAFYKPSYFKTAAEYMSTGSRRLSIKHLQDTKMFYLELINSSKYDHNYGISLLK